LEILWLVYHNSEIDWRIGEVKMTRCLEKCKKTVKAKAGKTCVVEAEGRKEKKRRKKRQEEKEQKKRMKKPKKEKNKSE